MRTFRILALASCALMGCSSGGVAKAPQTSETSAQKRLPPPGHFPPTARALLSDRMQHHGQAMSDIVWSVLFLDYDAAADIAEEIASEPQLARPVRREAGELNSLLPERFFALQEELVLRAKTLARVARTEDAGAIAQAIGELSGTCVRCHATYLRNPEAL